MVAFSDWMIDYIWQCSLTNRWRCNAFYFVVGALLSTFVLLDFARLFETEPFGQVQVIDKHEHDAAVDVSFSFHKYACTFKRLLIIGVVEGRRQTVLRWQSIDADGNPAGKIRDTLEGRALDPTGRPPDPGAYDRHAGEQIWHVRIFAPNRLKYDYIEIRTRHDCDDKNVDRVFARITV